jgi:3'(2'), 5'-bisphosphate nucleotidase
VYACCYTAPVNKEIEFSREQLQSLVAPLLALCRRAGDVVCRYYSQPGTGELTFKNDTSPLTRADLDSHEMICDGLERLTPGTPILSEESDEVAPHTRRRWQRFWLVDPLDGTREFVERTGEFTINVAMIAGQRPVLGVLYLPLQREAYVGIPGIESRCYRQSGEQSWSVRETTTRALPRRGVTVLTSRRYAGDRLQGCLDWLERESGPVRRIASGSAMKFCQLVDGPGDFYPRFAPSCEWDIAAGQAVLEAAGGALLGMSGEPLRYNARDTLLSPDFYAIAQPGHPLWQRLLQRR